MSLLPNLDQMTDNEKLAVLESIQKSIAESKEIQKKKIGENVDLVVQALKKIESDIRDRFDSVGNSIEKRVLSIKDGRDGSNGKDGRDGKDGKSGRDGLKGDRGADGQSGRDGVDGVDGISVVNANIDFDGSLVISLSDGREINVGEVVSADVAEKIKVISTMSTNAAVGIKDEGTSISTGVKNINFVGATVTATNSGDDVTVNVSAGTGTVTSVAATAGTGISVSGSPITTTGTLTITNTAPDQTVALTAGTGISTSGTYPNFTVTNTAPDQTVALTQGGTTTITGTYPNFSISSADQFSGTVTSVAASVPAFLSVTGSPITSSGTLAVSLSGTALPVLNGGTGVTTSTGTTNVVLSNSPTLVTPALGTPSALVGTNITGTATSFNINGTVGATTANTGAFTTLSATGVTTVQAGTAALPAITTTGDTNTGIFFPAADTIAFSDGGAETMRIDSSGKVGINTTNPTPNNASTIVPKLVLAGGGVNQGVQNVRTGGGGGGGAQLVLSSTKGADANTYTALVSGEGIGSVAFNGADGTRFITSATITANVDGAVSTDNVPARLTFSTSASGANNATERMRITSAGDVGIGTSSPASKLDVVGDITMTGSAWTAYTPTITSSSGSFTTVSATGKYKVFGKTCWFTTDITITTAGTAGGFIGVSLPFTQVATSLSSYGMEVNATGSMVKGLNPASGVMQITRYDNASIIGSGYVIRTTGTYEIT